MKIPNEGTFDVPYTMKGGIISAMNVNQKKLASISTYAYKVCKTWCKEQKFLLI